MSGDLYPPIASGQKVAGAKRYGLLTKGLAGAALAVVLMIGGVATGVIHLGTQAAAPMAAPPPPDVTVSIPLRTKRASWTGFTGQFSAVDRVEIRAQVSGYLTEIHFTDGQIVNKGDLLFVIDPRPYEIALEQAKAGLQTAQSSLELADQQLARTTELKRSAFASGEAMDQRVQAQRGAQAALEQAKASVRSAELNLEFSRITAPQSGRISTHRVSIGNLITGGQNGGATTLLTTIVSLDPIYLDFDMSEADYLVYQRYLHSRSDKKDIDQSVEAALSDEEKFTHRGTLNFIDNEMDRGSGTIHARARLPNKDLLIAPGQFARLRLPTSSDTEVLVVPDSAISADQSRKMLMTVAPDGTVVPKMVETGGLDGDLRVITSGIGPNDKVIINGLMRSRPGTKVNPKPGTITPAPARG
ncbi:MAG: efflux RND transporter periplasmic adaptor subunit [Beijerinckiaceae bacterium]|nr:efflux RND transporter periplasmic adaptor subunit [Beijerinckiaceae bacterium]